MEGKGQNKEIKEQDRTEELHVTYLDHQRDTHQEAVRKRTEPFGGLYTTPG